MQQFISRIKSAIGEFLILSIFAVIPAITVYTDIAILGNDVGELSVTEISEAAMVIFTIFVFAYGAFKHPDSRGFFSLVTGFFVCVLVRELDVLFDMIRHGFWFWIAITCALSTLAFAFTRCRDTIIGPMSEFIGTTPYRFMLIGLVIVLVFSRMFGSGNLLWKDLMGDGYSLRFKSGLQEGLELFGYLHIAYGSLLLFHKRYKH